MVAYSFKARFEAPLRAGTKRTTLRKVGKKRHVRPGERITFTTDDRLHPRLMGEATCARVGPIEIDFAAETVRYTVLWPDDGEEAWINLVGRDQLDPFARIDGFADWPDLVAFWRQTHGADLERFEGLRITWDDFRPVAA